MSEVREGVHNQDQERTFQVGHGVLCTHPEFDISAVCSPRFSLLCSGFWCICCTEIYLLK